MDQGKLDMFKQEMVRINIDILGISDRKWMGMGEFNPDDLYIYNFGQSSHRRHGVALIIHKKSLKCSTLRCNLKNDRMISVRFQCKPFNITVIQVYNPTTNAKEAEIERLYEDL